MRVWLVTVGEPLPTDGANERLLRTGILARHLVDAGHEVVWWTSSFDHQRKLQRSEEDRRAPVGKNLVVWLLHGREYRRHVSLARVVNHVQVARSFREHASSEARPDVILCSVPLIELADATTEYGRRTSTPVALDMRDMWPDIIAELVPRGVRPLARLALAPMYRQLARAARHASAITGITPAFVDWGLSYAGRERRPLDRDFPLAYSPQKPPANVIDAAADAWRARGVGGKFSFVVCFFGVFGRNFDFDTVLAAARVLEHERADVQFVLCGDGDSRADLVERARGLSNVIFPGWVDHAAIWALMGIAAIGLAPYVSSPSFEASYPNKAIEYLAAGLPVVSSLNGLLADLLAVHDCGRTYRNGEPAALCAALRELRDDPTKRAALGARGRALFNERFEGARVYSEMTSWLADLSRTTKT